MKKAGSLLRTAWLAVLCPRLDLSLLALDTASFTASWKVLVSCVCVYCAGDRGSGQSSVCYV